MPNGMANPQSQPLLPIGKHHKTMAELRQLCVDKFPLSKTRDTIMRGLEQVVNTLHSKQIVGELWVNGSFVTDEINPNDSDVVLFLQSSFVDAATPEQMAVIDWVNSNLQTSHCCDSYTSIEYPESHTLYWNGEYWRAYWMRQWGFSEDSSTLKGIAVISV